ncbi:DJ-1/PfpI family protein [Parasphingopyxis sp.]|uniref:DJ-1/PfpI family protein n=1 Tax=Parasphingopyxis sp. TaxID=1920299 RepID=UPI00262A2E0F|nr:DJ-1/PfpI family protein [Parasphingopyxis sp.]
MKIVILLYPNMTQLDFTGPFEVFAALPDAEIDLVWKDTEPVCDVNGLMIVPSASLTDAPQADLLFVPGGFGQAALMEDDEVLGWLRQQAEGAKYVTSVCTGSLVLAAAGLLDGYRATSHWHWIDQLKLFGAEPVSERVVIDRNRITGAGVSAGIDMALSLVAEVYGEPVARLIQLGIEYDPDPPFDGGHPSRESEELVAMLTARLADIEEARWEVAERAAARMKEREPTD